MRLWHKDIIQFLPNSQLIAQWRELNSIYAKSDKHILINFVYDYPKEDLLIYSNIVIEEMKKRGINVRSFDKYNEYFDGVTLEHRDCFRLKMDYTYLLICYYNLFEKFKCGQEDYDYCRFKALVDYMLRKGGDEEWKRGKLY